MPELLLITGAHPRYQDGDVLCAFNERRILCTHAGMVCHPKKAGFTRDGLRPTNSHAYRWYERTHRYRFERLSRDTIRRTDLVLGGVDELSDTPNAQGERINVELYLRRRKAHDGHRIFGTPGAEVWHGGTKDMSAAKMALVWADIEANSALRKADHLLWPLTDHEKRTFLGLPVTDFDDATQTDYEDALYDSDDPDTRVVLAKRKHRVDWRAVPTGRAEADILNRAVVVDVRETATRQTTTNIIQTRTRP